MLAQRERFSQRLGAGQDVLARLEPLRFSRIVGTHGHLQRHTAEVSEPLLAPIRERREQLEKDEDSVLSILKDGTGRARGAAGETMHEVRAALGFKG